MRHVKLPSNRPAASGPAPLPVSTPLPNRTEKLTAVENATSRSTIALTGEFVYVLKVALRESSLSAWMFFTHKKKFTQAEFDAMVAEAVQITNEVRPLQRRQSFVDTAKPIPQPVQKYNEDMFEADSNFMECVFADKWGFKKLIFTGANTTLACTILGQGDKI
jgi:hypothetical protein